MHFSPTMKNLLCVKGSMLNYIFRIVANIIKLLKIATVLESTD